MRLVVIAALLLSPVQGLADTVLLTSTGNVAGARLDASKRALEKKGHRVLQVDRLSQHWVKRRSASTTRLAQLFRQAKKLFVNEKYGRAIRLLEKEEASSLSLLAESPGGLGVLVQTNLWLGSLYLATGEPSKAQARFQLAVRLDSGARLDPAIWPPEYVRTFEQSRTQTPATGRLSVQLPAGPIRVLINGTEQPGRDRSMSWQLAAGLHYLFVHRPGSARFARVVSIGPASVHNTTVQTGPASAAELAFDTTDIPRAWLRPSSPQLAALAQSHSADQIVVVSSLEKWSYDRAGRQLSAIGADNRGDALVTAGGPEPKPLQKRWWFWTSVAAVVVGGSVTVWAISRDSGGGTVTGVFVR